MMLANAIIIQAKAKILKVAGIVLYQQDLLKTLITYFQLIKMIAKYAFETENMKLFFL